MRWTFFLVLLFMNDKEMAFGDEFSSLRPKSNDCNKEATKKAIKFLNDDVKSLTLAGKRMDREKLKLFLKTQDYIANQGSLKFIDWQDTSVTLKCGASGSWSVESGNKDFDKKFKSEDGDEFIVKKPAHQIAFKKFTCKTKSCEHIVYAFTRPGAKIKEFPIFIHEKDENTKLTCSINTCLFIDSKECKFGFYSVFEPEHTFAWSLPINKEQRYDMYNRVDQVLHKEGDNLDPVLKEIKIKSVPLKGSFDVRDLKGNLTGRGEKVVNPLTGSTITIKKAGSIHDGIYECVVTNKWGVVSTPEENAKEGLYEDIRYEGKAYVHVRGKIWTYVALGLCFGLVVLAIVMNFGCQACLACLYPAPKPVEEEVDDKPDDETDPNAES